MKVGDLSNNVIDKAEMFQGKKNSNKPVLVPPGHVIQRRARPVAGSHLPQGDVLADMIQNVRATIEEMLDDPENFGFTMKQVQGMNPQATIKHVCKVISEQP